MHAGIHMRLTIFPAIYMVSKIHCLSRQFLFFLCFIFLFFGSGGFDKIYSFIQTYFCRNNIILNNIQIKYIAIRPGNCSEVVPKIINTGSFRMNVKGNVFYDGDLIKLLMVMVGVISRLGCDKFDT